MEHQYIYKSESVSILPMGPDESESYRILRNRDDNRHYFFSGTEISQEDQKKWYEKYLLDASQYMFYVQENSSGQNIGGIGIYDIDFSKGCAEVGRIIIDKKIASGKHYGREAIKLIGRFASEELKLKYLYSNIYVSNIASIKSFESAGYMETTNIKKEIKNLRMDLNK